VKIEFNSDGAGCGSIILALAVGYIYGAAWGWATLGVVMIVTSIRITTKGNR